jgi:flagellar FliL protein
MSSTPTEAPKSGEPAPAAGEAGPPPAPSKLAQWLPLLASVALMPVLAYAITTFVLLPKLQKGLGLTGVVAKAEGVEGGEHKEGKEAAGGHGGGHGSAAAAGGASENVPLTKLLVNVSGTMGSRYLLTSLTLVGGSPGLKEKVEKHDAQLRDVACGLLSVKTISDLEKPGARNLIRSELISGFNHILGTGAVQEIYLTDFAIQ